jgi:hypothetical protein
LLPKSAFARFRLPAEMIVVAVRRQWPFNLPADRNAAAPLRPSSLAANVGRYRPGYGMSHTMEQRLSFVT